MHRARRKQQPKLRHSLPGIRPPPHPGPSMQDTDIPRCVQPDHRTGTLGAPPARACRRRAVLRPDGEPRQDAASALPGRRRRLRRRGGRRAVVGGGGEKISPLVRLGALVGRVALGRRHRHVRRGTRDRRRGPGHEPREGDEDGDTDDDAEEDRFVSLDRGVAGGGRWCRMMMSANIRSIPCRLIAGRGRERRLRR